jgi:hypothetical protein
VSSGLPGVRIGPLDPDQTADFGQVSKDHSARQLIRLYLQMNPQPLTRALARPLDAERTQGLVIEEVRGYVAGLQLENGDPVIPEGAEVVGAAVRGARDREQALTFTFQLPSGRVGKWFAEFEPGELPESAQAGDELVAAQQMRERGVVALDSEALSTETLRRQVSGLRRERDALRAQLASGGDGEDVDTVETDIRPDDQIVEDNQQLRVENEELRARNAQLEAAVAGSAAEALHPQSADKTPEPTAAEDEPVEGYDDLHAAEAVNLIKDSDRAMVQRILSYERGHANRRSVVGAGERELDKPE